MAIRRTALNGKKNVGFLPLLLRRFDRRHSIAPDSAKAYENPTRRTASRNTHEFPVPADQSVFLLLLATHFYALGTWL
jgi:hypothetical protein